MQDLLGALLGGGQQRNDYQDFVNRYDQGHPSEGYSGEEVLSRFQQVAANCSPQQFQESATEAFARLSPEERGEFARFLQQRAGQANVNFPDANRDGIDDRTQQDPGFLAQVASQFQQSGVLEQLLAGAVTPARSPAPSASTGTILDNPLAKAALAGIAAMAVRKVLENR